MPHPQESTKGPAPTPGVALLVQQHIPHRLVHYEITPPTGVEQHRGVRVAYGAAAAAELGIDPSTLFKTLLFALEGASSAVGSYAFAVIPSTSEASERTIAAELEAKRAVLASVDDVRRVTGSVPGGVSPLSPKRQIPLLLDQSALSLDSIVVSAGRRGLSVALAPHDLLKATGGRSASLTHPR